MHQRVHTALKLEEKEKAGRLDPMDSPPDGVVQLQCTTQRVGSTPGPGAVSSAHRANCPGLPLGPEAPCLTLDKEGLHRDSQTFGTNCEHPYKITPGG